MNNDFKYILYWDRVVSGNLINDFNSFHIDSKNPKFVEISFIEEKYNIKNSGIVVSNSFKENEDKYNIKYGFEVSLNKEDENYSDLLQDLALFIWSNELKGYKLISESVELEESLNKKKLKSKKPF